MPRPTAGQLPTALHLEHRPGDTSWEVTLTYTGAAPSAPTAGIVDSSGVALAGVTLDVAVAGQVVTLTITGVVPLGRHAWFLADQGLTHLSGEFVSTLRPRSLVSSTSVAVAVSTGATVAVESPAGVVDHLNDASDAHDASAIRVLDAAGNYTGTDVETVLAELSDAIEALPVPRYPKATARFSMLPTVTTDGMTTDANATTATGWYASSSGGTMAQAVVPLYGDPKSIKFSYVVKITKATAGSESRVGLHINGTVGAIPSGGQFTFTVGYKQGVGICFVRDNVGADVVILADASLADGQQYRINCVYDRVVSGVGTYTKLTVRVASLADARQVAFSSTAINHTVFTPVTNLVVKSNVAAGGVRDLQLAAPMLTSFAVPTMASHYVETTDSDAQSAYWLVPGAASDPLRLVVLCHGAGGVPANLDSNVPGDIRGFSEALCRAGFAVIYHALHGDNWGNTNGLADVVEIYETVRDNYDGRVKLYMCGISMGALVATLSAANPDLPVQAVYTIDGVFDLEDMWGRASYTAGINAAHPAGASSRNAANPMLLSSSLWAGMPFRMVASSGDTAVIKTIHTDVWAARSGIMSSTLTVPGDHVVASHFVGTDAANFFLTYS